MKTATAKKEPPKVMIELDFELRSALFDYIRALAAEIDTDVNGHSADMILVSSS
jgi:hypothetical protein